jgi:hypothetical protein
MGRLYLGVGTRYRWDGRTCVVVQVLRDGQLLVEDQPGGGQAVVTREDLTAAWDRGAVRFEVRGPGVRTGGEATLPTEYTIADFHLLPEAERAEAWRRYALIRPLLAWPGHARTRRAIEEYLATIGHEGRAGSERSGAASSRGSVERYLRAFEASGGDIRALTPATTRGDADRSGLGAEVEEVIQGVLAECRAAPAPRTVRDVYFMVVERAVLRSEIALGVRRGAGGTEVLIVEVAALAGDCGAAVMAHYTPNYGASQQIKRRDNPQQIPFVILAVY